MSYMSGGMQSMEFSLPESSILDLTGDKDDDQTAYKDGVLQADPRVQS